MRLIGVITVSLLLFAGVAMTAEASAGRYGRFGGYKPRRLRAAPVGKEVVKDAAKEALPPLQSWLPEVDADELRVLHKRHRGKNVLILDWDDTLLCTSYLGDRKLNLKSAAADIAAEKQLGLAWYGTEVGRFLTALLALPFDDILIVTNANASWVTLSAEKFLDAKTALLLRDKRVKIISAREVAGKDFPDDSSAWKLNTMPKVLETYLSNERAGEPVNLLAVGDSDFDREAFWAGAREFTQAYRKSVLLAPPPKDERTPVAPRLLLRQHGMLASLISYLFSFPGDLDLRFDVLTADALRLHSLPPVPLPGA